MSIEGGIFICYRHEYETGSVKKWDKHCNETYHELVVNQQCKNCGEWNRQTMAHPERYVELSHMGKDKLMEEIGRENVIVLKCLKCNS